MVLWIIIQSVSPYWQRKKWSKTSIVGGLTIKEKHVCKQRYYFQMEILSVNNQSTFIHFPISRFHIFIKSLFSSFRKYTLLTLENVSVSDSRINIFLPLSVSNCKLVREQLPKHKPRRPKPISDRYPESHSTQLISSQFLISVIPFKLLIQTPNSFIIFYLQNIYFNLIFHIECE